MTASSKLRPKVAPDRPPLTPDTSVDHFRDYYWYLDELVEFCRSHGLSTRGPKLDLVGRIESFLDTGTVEAAPPRRRTGRTPPPREGPLTLSTPVTERFQCDAETRAFFKSVIGDHFHFTAHLPRFRREALKDGRSLTYGDLVQEWLDDRERRKDPDYEPYIAPTWEYNRFVRDYMKDKTRNADKGIPDAAKAWNAIRTHKGPRTYAEYVRLSEDRGRA